MVRAKLVRHPGRQKRPPRQPDGGQRESSEAVREHQHEVRPGEALERDDAVALRLDADLLH